MTKGLDSIRLNGNRYFGGVGSGLRPTKGYRCLGLDWLINGGDPIIEGSAVFGLYHIQPMRVASRLAYVCVINGLLLVVDNVEFNS